MPVSVSLNLKPQRFFADASPHNDFKGETISTKIFVNLPVKNLKQSIEFFTQLGFQFMYGHGFQDLDGHIWESVYMEPNAINQG
jgi:hypothetical protein